MTKKIGVILCNLGSPKTPTTTEVKLFLREFLSDPRVVDVSPKKWQFILNVMILPFRSPRVAKLYQSIWSNDGSPLIATTNEQVRALQKQLDNLTDHHYSVLPAMTYGEPSMENAVKQLIETRVDKIILLPLYPQYSSSTTASVYDAFSLALKQHRYIPELSLVHNYHDHSYYINALASSIKERYKGRQIPYLLFSFHGIPESYREQGDNYQAHCENTANLVAKKLSLDEAQWQVTFQSRFGKSEWIKPYTDVEIENLAEHGINNIAIICPGFAADCLETLEEIMIQNRELFLDSGGVNFDYIPALNEHSDHISLLLELIKERSD